MLSYLRSVGIDDGFFPPHYKELKLKTFLVGTLYQGRTPRDIKVGTVTVDGNDGTERALEILRKLAGADVVFLDGVTVAGFNYIDPEKLLDLVKTVIVIYKFEPDLNKIESALRGHFSDWEHRYEVVLRAYRRSKLLETKWRTMRVAVFGVEDPNPGTVISHLQLVSPIPEPLRVSDIVASSLSRNNTLLSKLKKN